MLQSVRESIIFLAYARNAICEMVEFLEEADDDRKKELTNYIQNEASDYEIIHLLVTEDIPEEKYDIVEEEALWEIFRRSIVHDLPLLSEYIDLEVLETVIFDLGSVTALSLSSAAPLRKARADEGILTTEESFEAYLEKKGNELAELGGVLKTSHSLYQQEIKLDKNGKKVKGWLSTSKKYWQDKGKKFAAHVKGLDAGDDAINVKPKSDKKKTYRLPSFVKPAPPTPETSKQKVKRIAKQSGQDISTFAKTGTGKAVGAAAGVALVGYAGSKIWKNLLSKAARACRGKPDKAACITAYKRTHAPKKA